MVSHSTYVAVPRGTGPTSPWALHVWREPDRVTLQLRRRQRGRVVKLPALALTPEQYDGRTHDILSGYRLLSVVTHDTRDPAPEPSIAPRTRRPQEVTR